MNANGRSTTAYDDDDNNDRRRVTSGRDGPAVRHNQRPPAIPPDQCGPGAGDLAKLVAMTAADFNVDRYARHDVHETEIKDYVRTISYKNCIEYCAERNITNQIVLVVRCGIGLLPMFCVKSGLAKKVIALEQSSCIEYARRIIHDNSFSQQITLIQSSVHDLKKLPHGLSQVDIIVSDFMGECVIGQGDQMEQVIEARDRFLKPNGLMIPKCVTLYCQLLEQKRVYENQQLYKNKKKDKKLNSKKIVLPSVEKCSDGDDDSDSDSSSDSTRCSWWSSVYGFDMRSKREFLVDHDCQVGNCFNLHKEWCVMPEPLFKSFNPFKVVSNVRPLKEFDMYKCTIDDVRYVHCKNIKFKCVMPFTSTNWGDYAHMLELFMVVDFPDGMKSGNENNEDAVSIGFSTSSISPYTRFKQTGLLLRDQLLVNEGDEFTIDEFIMWRGPQKNEENKLFDSVIRKNIYNKSMYEENLKLRLRYTFVNKFMTAIDRRCTYTLTKYMF